MNAHRTIAATLAVAALAGGGVPTRGQSTNNAGGAVAPPPLTLDACIEAGLAFAEHAGTFEAERAAADAERREAVARSRPHLNVTPQARQFVPGEGGTEFGFSADFGRNLLEIPQNLARNRIARERVSIAEAGRERLRVQYAAQVTHACLACLRAREDLVLAERRLLLTRREQAGWQAVTTPDRRILDRLAQTGLAARQDEQAVADARALLAEQERQLRGLCGLDERAAPLAGLDAYVLPDVSLEACLAWARAHRGDLQTLRRETDLMDEAVRLARLDRLPKPRLAAGYDPDTGDPDTGGDVKGAFVLLALEVPLWDAGEIRARAAQLEARRDAMRIHLTQLEAELATQVADAYLQWRQAARTYSGRRADPAAARTFREAEVRLAAGELSRHAYDQAALQHETHLAAVEAANRACYAAEAALLEAVQARRADLAVGLPVATEPASP